MHSLFPTTSRLLHWSILLLLQFRPTTALDVTLSQTTPEFDLDEELDTFLSSRRSDIVSLRYDKLRRLAVEVQSVLGHVSSLVERLFLLFSWRDRRTTALSLFFCLITGAVLVLLWRFMSRYLPLFIGVSSSCHVVSDEATTIQAARAVLIISFGDFHRDMMISSDCFIFITLFLVCFCNKIFCILILDWDFAPHIFPYNYFLNKHIFCF